MSSFEQEQPTSEMQKTKAAYDQAAKAVAEAVKKGVEPSSELRAAKRDKANDMNIARTEAEARFYGKSIEKMKVQADEIKKVREGKAKISA